jgi:dTDP-4-amino-4,6-dideoxygalactose transaminase
MAIKLLVPDMPTADDLLVYLRRIDANRQYTNFGPLVRELEERLESTFAADTGCRAVTFSNCTYALTLWLQALDLPLGSRVAVPALTFPATGLSILNAGLVPVLVDSDALRWVVTPEIISEIHSYKSIAAVLAVATFGAAHDPKPWVDFSQRHGIPVLIDAAGAVGNQLSATGLDVAYSLHATKTLGGGEGGFILSTNLERLKRMRQLTNFGIVPEGGGSLYVGTNAKMSEYHAAVALASLDRWPVQANLRRLLYQRYCKEIGDLLSLQEKSSEGVYSIFVGLVPSANHLTRALSGLARAGIETRRWYLPTLDQHPVFGGRTELACLGGTEAIRERLIGLPFHPFLTDRDLLEIVAVLRNSYRA